MCSILLWLGLALCDDHVYTLYRNSLLDLSIMRVHVASFDSKDGEKYNQENCQIAASLFQAKFWCEKGRYRP
jgi:hypothetical protein